MWSYLKTRASRLLHDEGGFWNILIPAAASLLGGVFGGKKAKKTAQQRSGGATLQQLMPLIMQMMQQQQAQSGQNYGFQTQRYQANLPVQDALRSMMMGMLPAQYTSGLNLGQPLSQQPMPPLAPIKPDAPAPAKAVQRPARPRREPEVR